MEANIAALLVTIIIVKLFISHQYKKIENQVLDELGFSSWDEIPTCKIDENIIVKSRQALNNYDDIKFLSNNSERFNRVKKRINLKSSVNSNLKTFLLNNQDKTSFQYQRIKQKIMSYIENPVAYKIHVTYISTANNNLGSKDILITEEDMTVYQGNPAFCMSKKEYSNYFKEQKKREVAEKQHEYYEKINTIIDTANDIKDELVVKGRPDKLDKLIDQLFIRTINSIKRIKTVDSEEWDILGDYIIHVENEVNEIAQLNKEILDYYKSDDFIKIKEACKSLMSSQEEFNTYIDEKVKSITSLFGTQVARHETINEDEYNYIRPYKKTITPFTAEVSSTVFASAENSPLDYVVKKFYPDKQIYPDQIRKLHLLIEELETLKEAKVIIENYKKEYQEYLASVPSYIIDNDEAGFYSRLGFANIDENVFNIAYEFSYTSNGGMAKRSFSVPMTEETIIKLIRKLESKLTAKAFAIEQRNLMTSKLREEIKKRDNYTCCNCGNSIEKEPNLLLEIDHIIPVSKGGCTVKDNLQTLCWKCNRSKGNKIE